MASSTGTGAVASTSVAAAATSTQKSAAGKSVSCWIRSWCLLVDFMVMAILY
jgi:hypothetical protein